MKKSILLLLLPIITLSVYAQNTWVQVWGDEFNYTGAPDAGKWGYDIGGNGWGNSELQYYTNEIENAFVENGELTIRAIKEPYNGSDYTSARLVTKNKAEWKYGKFEIRAKVPTGKGMWSAIWLLPSTNTYGGWPKSGEIDIMENVGFDPNTIHWNIHTEAYNHTIGTNKGTHEDFVTPYAKYYTYTLEWYEDKLIYSVDGVPYFQFDKESDDYKVWPFKEPFHLILNTAIGGTWGGLEGVDNTVFPEDLIIDYVRVYKLSETKNNYNITVHQNDGGTAAASTTGSVAANTSVTFSAVAAEDYEFVRWLGTFSNTSNPITVNATTDIEMTPVYQLKGDLLLNGQLNEGLSDWWYNNGGSAAFSIKNNALEIAIQAASSNAWDKQFIQDDIALVNGHTYQFSFDASSTSPTSFSGGVGLDASPWTAYLSRTISTTSTKKTYTYTFTMTTDDNDARVFFDLGKATGTITMDNFSLVDLTITAINSNLSTEGLTIYPNPVQNQMNLNITEEIVTAKAINTTGQAIELKVYNGDIDATPLSTGNYILVITTNNNTLTQSFFKE